jgi:hypothetical protein
VEHSSEQGTLLRNGPVTTSRGFAAVGAGLLALAGYFVWRDLGVGAEYLLVVVAVVAAAAELTARPRSRPHAGLVALLGCTLIAGAWFGGGALLGIVPRDEFHPVALLLTMGIAVAGCVGAWARLHVSGGAGPVPARVAFPVTLIGMVLSAALYYQFFTVGVAAEHVARRLILTLTWLPVGLLLEARGQARGDRNLAHAGLLLVAGAVVKAILYDTTHLAGGLRVAVLGVAGLLLLGGASLGRVVGRERA